MKKSIYSFLALSVLLLTATGVFASTYDCFFGGVTGVPGNGRTWGSYTPSSYTVTVTAKGKTTSKAYGWSYKEAYASVPRAVSGNQSNWGYGHW